MFYIVYKTTNTINGKIYVGAHSTNNIGDGYMGSGKVLNRAILKYGTENFFREIIKHCGSLEEMYEKEKSIVNSEFVQRQDTYNIMVGGRGGFEYVNSNELNNTNTDNFVAARKVLNEKMLNNLNFRNKMNTVRGNNLKKAHMDGKVTYDNFKGMKHTEETKLKISKANTDSKHQAGEKNSQYGTMWIYNEEKRISTRIKKTDKIPKGWNKGRIIDFEEHFKKVKLRKEASHAKSIKKIEKELEIKKETVKLYNTYIDGDYISLRDFHKRTEYEYSLETLSRRFRKYIDGYEELSSMRVPIKNKL